MPSLILMSIKWRLKYEGYEWLELLPVFQTCITELQTNLK